MDGGTDDRRCGSIGETHPFLVEMSTMHPELSKTGNCAQANHVLQRLKIYRMSAEQKKHEFFQDFLRDASLAICVNNTGNCQPL